MNEFPDRNTSLELLAGHLKSEQMLIHSLSVEAVMTGFCRALTPRISDSPEMWARTGLLHDIDYELTEKDSSRHALVGAEILRSENYPQDIVNAVLAHNGHTEPDSMMAKALIVADALSGLVYAGALMRPDRRASTMNVKSLKKKYKSKGFAAGANRQHIALCEEWLDLTLESAMEIAINSMGAVEESLGLANADNLVTNSDSCPDAAADTSR
ncbi:MAG: phosphohydrolase [Candidatus Wallbacteria bacterium HGW-Wallbacteria-1]|jgi:hypothetical protein|uniref:Phosphohydrolase n=1 Tax=Candidatus Wallbacteria bacterium HGW-Wallbacteria-1 TaxID=2013854 RepID=A0A2N1PQ05_9BACT|nr:MAG: phosphohydrolase [Candidatus Wallbacteria bacterium HGW-Wallbacteria-1]